MSESLPVLPEKQKVPGITTLQRKVIELMVHQAMDRRHAAETAGTSDRNVRYMFKRRTFCAAFRAELAALRESERARSIARICALRDQDDHKKTAFDASRFLAADPEDKTGNSITVNVAVQTPGYIVSLPREQTEIEATLRTAGSSKSVWDAAKQ